MGVEEENEKVNREDSLQFLCYFIYCIFTGISEEWEGSIIVNS